MKPQKEKKTLKDKSDRATVDSVLDPRTLKILEKLVKRGKLFDVEGCLCAGKEANVYLGRASTDLSSKFINSTHLDNKKKEKNVYDTRILQKILREVNMKEEKGISENKKQSESRTQSENKKQSESRTQSEYTTMIEEYIKTNDSSSLVGDCNSSSLVGDCNSSSLVGDCNLETVPVAIKIYTTSIMPFKDRERYLESEMRFQSFCSKNPRKLVKLWAEKEVRNLKRMKKHEIPCPEPIYLKNNILIMTLIGNIAKKLKDADVSDWVDCYDQCIRIMEDMYNKAGLIHADMSEFNLLYWEGKVYVIDVGQSVEKGHINSNSFLIMDIINLNAFFLKKGIRVIETNCLYERVSGKTIPEYLKGSDLTKDTFIPCRMTEVSNIEDIKIFEMTDEVNNREEEESTSQTGSEDEEVSTSQTGSEDDEGKSLDRKERKRIVKEWNRQRRAARISKSEKEKIFKKYKGKKASK